MSTTPATSRFSSLCEAVKLVLPDTPENLIVKARTTNGRVSGDPIYNTRPVFPENTIGTMQAKPCEQDDWKKQAVGIALAIEYQGRAYRLDYWLGVAHFEIIPTRFPGYTTLRLKDDALSAASILANLLMDHPHAEDSFEGFCAELGYDNDRISSKRIYRAVRRQARKVAELLGDDLDDFLSAFQDQNDY